MADRWRLGHQALTLRDDRKSEVFEHRCVV